MNGRLIRAVAATALLTTATAPLGCGYLLYPERRGSGQLFLEVQNDKGATARFPTSMEMVGG